MLFHLIYVSTAVNPMSADDLARLLHECRTRNEQDRITGMLLYKGGYFMQVLEGDESAVMKLFASIERDPRHKNVDILRAEYIQHRNFPDWTMGFKDLDSVDPATVPGYTRFLELDFRADHFSEDSVEAHAMLMAFRDRPET